MLRSKYPEALKVADDASNLFKSNGFIRNQVLQSVFVAFFSPMEHREWEKRSVFKIRKWTSL